jgi:hypothetical protein
MRTVRHWFCLHFFHTYVFFRPNCEPLKSNVGTGSCDGSDWREAVIDFYRFRVL